MHHCTFPQPSVRCSAAAPESCSRTQRSAKKHTSWVEKWEGLLPWGQGSESWTAARLGRELESRLELQWVAVTELPTASSMAIQWWVLEWAGYWEQRMADSWGQKSADLLAQCRLVPWVSW